MQDYINENKQLKNEILLLKQHMQTLLSEKKEYISTIDKLRTESEELKEELGYADINTKYNEEWHKVRVREINSLKGKIQLAIATLYEYAAGYSDVDKAQKTLKEIGDEKCQ